MLIFVLYQPYEEEQKLCRRNSIINTENLKSFVARKRWKVGKSATGNHKNV